MARVTVEDCVDKVTNRFDLVMLSAQRARQISGGAELTIDRDRDKNPVVALREIAETTVKPRELEEALVSGLQRVQMDDDDVADEVGSLSQSAEALRLTAAAPAAARQHAVAGDDDRDRVSPHRHADRPSRPRSAGAGGEFAIGDGRAGRHLAQKRIDLALEGRTGVEIDGNRAEVDILAREQALDE